MRLVSVYLFFLKRQTTSLQVNRPLDNMTYKVLNTTMLKLLHYVGASAIQTGLESVAAGTYLHVETQRNGGVDPLRPKDSLNETPASQSKQHGGNHYEVHIFFFLSCERRPLCFKQAPPFCVSSKGE